MNRQRFEYHPTFGYRFIPDLRARVDHEGGGYLVRVNPDGFRSDRAFSPDKREGTFRVLLFGDSFTAGDGVSNGKRYSDVLEKMVPNLEVYNFGLSGSGTDQQLLIFREYGPRLQHDLVVVGLFLENIYRSAARFRPYGTGDGGSEVRAKPYFTVEPDGRLKTHHVPVPRDPVDPAGLAASQRPHLYNPGRYQWVRRTVRKLAPGLKGLAQRVSRYQPLPVYDDPEAPEWVLLRAILTAWAGESRAPVLVCLIPVYQYIEETADPSGYQARFRELEAVGNLHVHDALPDFLSASEAERRRFRFERDTHLSPKGHRALARSLAPRIESLRASTNA